MYYDSECIIIDVKHVPIACGLYIKSDYPDILEDEDECYSSEDAVDLSVDRVDHYNNLFKDIFSINIPLKEDTFTPLYSNCFF